MCDSVAVSGDLWKRFCDGMSHSLTSLQQRDSFCYFISLKFKEIGLYYYKLSWEDPLG